MSEPKKYRHSVYTLRKNIFMWIPPKNQFDLLAMLMVF